MHTVIFWLLFLFSLFLIIMSIIWLSFVNTPSKLQNLTWFYGYTVLALGIIGFLYIGVRKLKLHNKAYEYYNKESEFF